MKNKGSLETFSFKYEDLYGQKFKYKSTVEHFENEDDLEKMVEQFKYFLLAISYTQTTVNKIQIVENEDK